MTNSLPKIETSTINVHKCIHLLGGLRAGTGHDGQLIIHPMGTPLRQTPIVTIGIREQRRFVGYFRSIGLDMIGFEDLHTDHGYTHSRWQAWDPDAKSIETDLDYIWGGIANVYRITSDTVGEQSARNVLFGLRAVSKRLRDISEAYCAQTIIALCYEHKPNLRFENLETMDAFLAIHSFLVEMGTLRDYLAVFLAKKRFDLPISRMSQLFKACKKLTRDEVAHQILQLCDKDAAGSWLAQMSQLRDHIVHVSPITSRTSMAAFVTKECRIETHALPSVELGITLSDGSTTQVDALRHCLELYRAMLQFIRFVAHESGIKPVPFAVTDADLR